MTGAVSRARTLRTARASVWLALGLLDAACRSRGAPGGDDAGPARRPEVRAQVVRVRTGPLTERIGLLGTVQARAGHAAVLSAPAPTRVARVLVTAGQSVAKGASLVELEQAAFQASARSAETSLAAAERGLERAQRLVSAGVAPRKDLDQAESELARARAEAVLARRSAELSVLRSPIAGVVTRVQAVLGASVDANQPLVEVVDPASPDLVLSATPADAARIPPGAAVAVRSGESRSGARLGAGKVVDVGAAVDSATRTVTVRARVTAGERPLRIGETVYAEIDARTIPRALTIPAAALLPDGDGFRVFVVGADGLAEARAVEVGVRSDSLVEVVRGLKEGERIVGAGAYGVEDSAKVVEAP